MTKSAEPSTPSGSPKTQHEGDRSRATKIRQLHPLRTPTTVPTRCRQGADDEMSVQRITKRVVDAAKPENATYLIRDAELKGFVLVVTPYGGKSYAVDYRAGHGRCGRKRRLTIGKHGSPWTPETARREAFKLLADISAGIDPSDLRVCPGTSSRIA